MAAELDTRKAIMTLISRDISWAGSKLVRSTIQFSKEGYKYSSRASHKSPKEFVPLIKTKRGDR